MFDSIHKNGAWYGDGFRMTDHAKADQLDSQPVIDSRKVRTVLKEDPFIDPEDWVCEMCGHWHCHERCIMAGDEVLQECEGCKALESLVHQPRTGGCCESTGGSSPASESPVPNSHEGEVQ